MLFRSVRTPRRHPYAQNPTHNFHALRPRRTDTYRRRLHLTCYPLGLTLLQRRCPLQLRTEHPRHQDSVIPATPTSDCTTPSVRVMTKTDHPRPQDSVIPTAPTSDSTTPSVRVMTKTDHPRHQDSVIPATPTSDSTTPSSATQENPLTETQRARTVDPDPRPKTLFRNQIVPSFRK